MRRILRLLVALAALVTGIAAVVVAAQVPGAPVVSSTSTVTWPREGEAPTPTTLFLVPYRPASLEVTVPCRSLQAARDRPGDTTVFATAVGAPADGLAVRTRPGTDGGVTAVQVISSGRVVPVEVPDTDCGLSIVADADGLAVTVGERAPVTVPGDPVPEVFAATTDLAGADADGLGLTARTPAWFDNAPTPGKSSLATTATTLALASVLLVVLARVLVPTTPAPRSVRELASVRGLAILRTRGRRASRRLLAAARKPWVVGRLAVDAVVALGLTWWSIVGPLTDDDGFATVIARQTGAGDPANYYRWFNASEVPFGTNQRLLASFVDLGAGPLGLRALSVAAGLLLWVVLTRGVLRPALGAAGRTVVVRVLAALALALWWLPYDLGARPEPVVALGTVVVTALVLRAATRDGRGHPVVLIALAALIAGLTVTVAPSGLIAAAPFLLCLPRLLRAVGDGPPREDGRVARATRLVLPGAHLAAIAGLAVLTLVVVFTDQSWHGFLVATDVHQQIGPNQPWYAEWLRYGYLFGEDSWGAAAKRVPVVAGLILGGTGLVVLARGTEVLGRESVLLLGLLPAGFGLLAVTPSKWSHHFGALAGFGAIGVVAVLVALWRAGRRRDPVVAATAAVATLLLALGAAFAFSGPNAWWAYSGFGLPGSTGPQRPFDSIVVWLLVAVAGAVAAGAFAWVRWSRGPDDEVVPRPVRAALAAAPLVPAATGIVVIVVSVLLLGSSFSAAGDRAGYSLAAQNRAALAGAPGACGLQDRVQVLTTVPGGPLTPVRGSSATMSGFVADGGAVDAPPVRPDQTDGTDGTPDTRDGRFTWGSRADGDGSVGDMTTGWFGLRRPGADQLLAVGVAGRTADGASLTWEFGRGDRVVGERRVVETPEPDRGYKGYAGSAEQERLQDAAAKRDRWRTVTLTPDEVPDEADRVRLRATDDRTDAGGWIAFTGPRVVEPEPLDRWLADRGPVLVDWAIAFAWPCAGELPRVAGGVAQTPGAIITAPGGPSDPVPGERTTNPSPPGDIVPERWTGGSDGLFTGQDSGGSFAGLNAAGSLRELDTRLPDEPSRRWGRVLVPDLEDLEADRYGVATATRTIPGTDGDPAPVVNPAPLPIP